MFDFKTIYLYISIAKKITEYRKTADIRKFGANSDCYLSYKRDVVGEIWTF